MDNKILEIFIPGPAGRLEAKYFKSKKNTSPVALGSSATSTIWWNNE
jgi:alpha/beta superfamily hydrolase